MGELFSQSTQDPGVTNQVKFQPSILPITTCWSLLFFFYGRAHLSKKYQSRLVVYKYEFLRGVYGVYGVYGLIC